MSRFLANHFLNSLTRFANLKSMLESIFAAVLPVAKDLLITIAAGLMAYAMNKLQSYVTSF